MNSKTKIIIIRRKYLIIGAIIVAIATILLIMKFCGAFSSDENTATTSTTSQTRQYICSITNKDISPHITIANP